MATPTPSPLQIIREELPRFLNEPHAADFKDVLSSLIPQSPAEAALEVAFAPISRPARMAALATAALTASPDAEGAGGILLRNAPDLKRWLDSNDIERRLPHQESILSKFARLFRSMRPGDMPSGITGQDTLEELAPQLVAAEGYLPAGQSLVHSKLGRQLFQTPEEKLWYLSRRYPTPLDLDAMTGAAPR